MVIIYILVNSCDLSFLIEPFGEIKGTIQYEDGTPCEGLRVFYGSWVYNIGHPGSLISEESDSTDNKGQFSFSDVESLTEWVVKISDVPDGFQSSPETHNVNLDKEEVINISFTLIPND